MASMRILVLDTPADAARVAAAVVTDLVAQSPAAVLGFATGSSPQPLYRALAEKARNGVDFASITGFALDEYVGIDVGHPESYRSVLARDVVGPLGMAPLRMHVPDGLGERMLSGRAYENAMAAAGGVDLQILGIGANGHIGFNEPGSELDSRTRDVALAERTREDNKRFFDGDIDRVPSLAITQGIGTILEARELLLVANGAAKARAIATALESEPSASCPASVIRRHPDVTVVLDVQAASLLRQRENYRAQAETWLLRRLAPVR